MSDIFSPPSKPNPIANVWMTTTMTKTVHASGVGSSIRINELTTIDVAATPANETGHGRSR